MNEIFAGHMGSMSGGAPVEMTETQKLQALLAETEQKWRTSYEKLAKELDVMKTKGAVGFQSFFFQSSPRFDSIKMNSRYVCVLKESVVAAQWRARYEGCLRDKEEVQQKLSLYTQLSTEIMDHGKSLETLHIELQEEYKVCMHSFILLEHMYYIYIVTAPLIFII